MKWVSVGLLTMMILSVLFITGCSKKDNYNPSNFIDYSKPMFHWFDKDAPPVVNTTTTIPSEFVQQIPEDRDYWVGTFNIQIFGKTKAENTPVYNTIVDIVNDYDIIAIQEVRDNSGVVAAKLQNIPGMRVEMSERLGRTISKEQYAFLWSGRVTPGITALYPDPGDRFEREPYAMDFTLDDFHFVILNVHIKPEDAQEEIKALPDVVDWAKQQYLINDVFIMGDLNMDCHYFNKFNITMTNYVWLISEKIDTTVSPTTDCSYDRIIMTEQNPNVLSSGVDHFEDETDGDEVLIEAVSDHWLVYWTYKKAEVNTTIE